MKNTRDNRQTQVKNCLKWTASGLLLALLFVLVFAGTLSGAFGIENELQQNGIIQSNVASADWNHKAGIDIGDTNSGGYNVTAMNAISEADTYNYFSNTANDTAITSKFGIYMSDGSSSDCQKDHNTIAIDQGPSTSGRNGMIYAVIPLSAEVQKVVAQGRLSMSFSAYFEGGNSSYSSYRIFAYSSSLAVTPGVSYSQAAFKDSILNNTTTSATSSQNNTTTATGNAGYCNATGIPDKDWNSSHSEFSYRTITANVLPGAKSIIFGCIVRGGGYHGAGWRHMEVSIGRPTITFHCSSASIEVTAGDNGTIDNVSLNNATINGTTYTFNKVQANATIDAIPTEGYHFDKWEKTYNGETSIWTNAISNYAKSTATFYSYNVLQNEQYKAYFSINKISVVFHRNLVSGDTQQRTQEYTYNGNDLSLGHWENTANKTFVGWAKADSPNDVYHKYGKTSGGTYDCVASQSDIAGKSLVNALDHGSTIHLYAVWVDSDFGVLSGKDKDSTWGLETNPFVISNVQHLKNLSDIVNGSRDPVDSVYGVFYGENINTAASDIKFENCYFVIASDIGTATGNIDFVPIGKNGTYYFAGTIYGGNDSDANNRTMRTINLNIQQSGVSNVGLFGYVKGASISYIKTAGTIVGGNATGGLVGCMENGEIFNCANSATVTGREQVGGIVGYNPDNQRGKIYGTIINNGAINGTNMVGGLVGQWHGEWNLNGTYGTFTNTGDVNGGTGASVGGIAGFADRTIKNAANSGNVVGGTSVGGIAGRCQAPIENSYNTGDVRGTATTSQGEITGSPTGVFVGGITGYTSANASISNCYNTGHISALSTSGGYLSNANYVGGIVGFAQAAVSYCANIGGLIEGNDYLGGIVGNSSSTIDHCYDVQGQRKHRYDTGRIGAISGYGGTATNSWAINAKANDGSTCSNPNPTISNVGKVFVSVGDVAPAVIDGYTEKVWTDILTIYINGFKATATVNNGKFLASATASNGATSVVPAKIDGALTANANGASAQQTTDATLTYWYNANTSSNIYVQIKNINGAANSKTYNGANQTIDNVSASPFTATAFYFDANYAGTATDGKMNAGTYSVIVDVVVDGNVVGRKLFASWTINKRNISQNLSSATYHYGARILSPDIANILTNIVDGHSVTSDKTLYNFYDAIPASGSRTYTITYTNIRIVANGSDVTGNYKINNSYTFTITVNEGDFGVYGTTDIEKNPWGSVNNPYVIRTQAQLERLSFIVAGGSAVNSIYHATNYPYVKAINKSFANAYFVLDGNISMTYTSSFSYSNISSSPAGNSGETADKLFDNNTSSSKLCVSNNAKTVTIYVSTNVPIIVNSYSWWTGNDTSGNTGRNPNYFKIEGSTDGSNWYVIDERSNGSWPTTNNTQVDVTGMNGAGRAGRYNRFRITSTCSGGTWQASEFKFNYVTSEQSVPIGNSSTKFSGTFDGKNHTISNLKTSGQYSGLFGYVNGATIQNLTVNVANNAGATSAGGLVGAVNGTTTIRNCTVNGTISGTHQVGGFVGFAQGVYQDNTLVLPCNLTIEGCTNNATVTTTSQASDNNRTSAGGFVGYVNAGATVTITSYTDENGQTKKSTNNGKISTTSSADNKGVGGFVGYSYGKITLTDCVNEKNATITGKERVGGLVGYIGKADSDSQKEMVISGCENKAAVTSNSTNDVYGIGGIVGYNSGHKVAITNCINSGAITGTHETAGIIGYSDHSEISNCTNSGAVSGFATVGGIVGKMGGGSIVSCKNTGTVKASKARDIDGVNGAYLGGIAGWAGGNVNNCYNSGTVTTETSWGNSNIVGGIVGYLVNGKTVSYCYNSGTIVGSSQIGGIIGYLPGALTTVTYCYHSGKINSVWNENNVAKGSLGYITGNDTSILNSCWILPGASTDSASSTKIKTNGRKLDVGQYRYVPAIIDDYSTYGWTDILTKNINGFRVQESVNPGASQFFESKKGSNSTTHLTPNKTESSNQANALIRDNTDSFTITAWYGANTDSDIYCAVNTIAIDTSADTYNNAQLGFTRSDVTTPGTSGSVYGIVFDYKGKNHNEIFVCAFDSNGNIVAGSTNPTQVDTYNTTVFVKIGDIVVGKKIAVDYTIDKAALNVGWEWTDKLHANLYDRTGNGDKVQFVYNGKAQGLDSVSEHLRDVQLFDVTGNDLTNTNAATYTRTYTLKDTRNYKLQNANNNNADLSGTTVTFEWKIRKNKLTVSNYWTGADLNPSGEFYTFEYNATHQGLKLQDGITFYVEPDTRGNQHVIDTIAYEIAQGVECVAVDTYTRTFTIKDTTNYEVGNRLSYNTSVLPNQKGSDVNTEKSVVTYTWKIVPYSLATNITSGNVWFGGTTNLIVGNQGIANVNVGNQSYADKRFYPLQSEQTGVQKVLVYAQHNYAADKFVLYVKYNNGTVAVLTQGTEYTVGTLDTNNTFGTFVNVVSQADPVVDTNVTASGTGNFSGNITKYYTAMFSDFGWKKDKSPSDEDWGSQDNPYVISTPEHLLRLSQIVNGGMAWNSIQNTVTAGVCIAPQTTAKATSRDYKDAYFLVTADIDMSGYISTDGVYNFLPIGTRSTQNQTELPFSATFDGGDNTITYVYNVGSFYNVDGARTNYVGLFGYLNGATISNLKVASNGGLPITDNEGIVGIEYVGGIAGYAVDSTLYNSVLAYGGWVRGENYVGGIVGYGERITIESSEAVSSANVGGETYVGGIVGKWIVSNQNQIGGSVAGQRYVTPADQTDVMGIKYVGGIAGWMDTSSCATTISYAPQLNNNGKEQNLIVVGGIEYVGALFGAFIGNGYHQNATNDKYTAIVIDKDASDKFKVGNVKVLLQKLNEKSASGNAKVVGGLVGYAEGVGILFNTDWTTSNVTLDTGNYTPSFIGGIAGVLGKNATIEAINQLKNDGTFLTGGTHTITHSVPDEQKTFGTAAKPLGSFVGGIVGYVSSQAGVYWETGTTIFGNGISLVNLATIYATSYAGGIFGALGDLSTSVASSFESDTDSILYKVLTTGVREGSASTTLGLAPTVDSNGITAQGRLVNNASISVSGSYVGGIAGYGGAKVRFVLRNTPQDSAIDVSKLNIYSGGSDIFINGSYAGGIAGYLVDNLEHDLQYIVVKARFNTNNQSATRVGGLVGYMGSGNVQNCVVTNGGSSTITASTDTYQGSEYVGGLVGETQNATIRNSVSTGFNLEKTSNTKGGLLGYGANPTIDSSWTFYIAKKRTNFAKNATPNGAYYATVSQSPYGKYILVDEGLINATESSYPTFASLCGFVGLLTNANVEGTLEFAVKVPNKTLDSNYENTQLAFYNASGSDTVTDNVDSFSKFENKNNTLTIALDMASGNSMQICVVGIEFVNVPQKNDTDTDKTTVVEGTYRKPSNSDKYIVHVTTANFNSERQITKIVATVYFECNGNLPVVIGSAYDDKRNIGGYDETFTPGSSTNPYTISSQKEWNDFAYSVYSGAKDYAGEYVKLLTNITINNTTAHMGTASSSTPLNFSTECTPNNNSDDNKNAKSNLGYNLAGNISQGSSAVNRIYFGTSTTLSTTTPSFKGTFDGNGNTIDIQYTSGGYHRISVFPNAANATFKNLTINGTIAAGTNTSNSGYDIAAFVGKPFGAITFTNCTAAVDIQGLRVIAGFSGYSSSTSPITLIGCVNKGDITSFEGSKWNKSTGQNLGYPDDYQYGTGGLIAYATNDITIDSCLNTGNVVGQTKVGGLVGRVTAFTTIKNSANTGDITGEEVNPYISNDDKKQAGNAWSRVGGLVGEASKTATLKMYACYNTGAIRGKSNVAGGLVGILGTIPSNEKPHSTEANNTSTIAYCYNTGEVTIGWTQFGGITMVGLSGYNFNGTDAGGLVGVAVKLNIEYSYNTGDIHGYGGVGNLFTWQVRNGGILAEACTKASNCSISINNCYSTGRIYIEENKTNSDTRYSADIVGYLDEEGGDSNDGNSKVRVANCYGIANNIVSRKDSAVVYYSGWNSRSGNVKYVRTGTTLNSLSDLTAIMRSDGSVKPRAFYYANNQNNEVELWNASTATIKDGAQNTTAYKNGTLGGYVYVYGCLPQLAVFAVDTYNGLSMNSQNYGQDIYGEYREQKAGEEYSPYVIRDGIDLMGVQTLVGLGYTFAGKYIEFANGSNNITLDKNLSSDVAKAINMPISNSTSTKIADSENAYKSLGKDNTYHIGKSYHLFKLSAVCYDDNNIAQNTAYGYWLSSNHYYNGAYGNKEGAYKNYGTFKTQNILTIGRNGKVFKGSISGKQENNANTVINNLRITSGQTIGGAYGGLFGHVENAYIGYIEVGGESNIWAYSSDNQQIAATGAIAGYVTGDSIIEHCAVSGTTAIGAYGKNDDTHIASDITYAGGIVGLTDPKQGSEYKAGISAIIKGCTVNISTTTGDRAAFAGIIQACKSNIGGVLGYVGGDAGASGKGNTVRIEGCSVDKAVIQAASSANTSSQIGGILGYGSQYVAAFITDCKVGVGGAVSIKGEHSLGGIAGGMSNAKGGYIDSCTVGANTTIERIAVGNDNTVLESPKHGTAIGGLVGFTQDSKDDTSPLTTTFSGTSAFGGTITVSVEATNKSQDSDAKISCIGGIVGDMGSGANFASGSNVTVGGNINITLAAANVGGVVGRTNKATFIGKFNVAPNMSTENAENVGGFIGKNIGTVYILADTTDRLENTTVGALNGTEITIGGKIKGTSEVGGFIGVNNSGSTLNIGSNVANAKPYKSGTLTITITASVTGSHDNVGGIVGKNEGDDENTQDNDYATIDIVKGTIEQNGAIIGANNVGGIIGLNDGLLTTGGGEADTTIGGVTLSEEQQNKIKNLSINNTGSVTGTGDYVGGVVGKLDSPSALRTEDSGKGAIAGTFTNSGNVSGGKFVGGSLGYVGKNVTITAKNNVATLFVNDGQVTATGYYAGGSIGVLVGKIEGVDNGHTVNFKNTGTVTATGFVGGSIGVLAGPVKYAQFVNSSGNLSIAAVNAVGGSVGFIGVPTPLETILTGVGITLADDYVKVENTHFEASGELTANPDSNAISVAKDAATNKSTGWGGVGGAIGVIGKNVRWGTEQNKNTYYANGNVTANGINNVGGIVGIILAENVNISNMLAYNTTVKGGENVGGIVGATDGIGTVITSAYAIEGTFTGSKNVGGIIGLAKTDTDASTSYWVKGYTNAILAGTDVKNLQQDLGKFETIIEYVGEQPIVFTEEFCKMYTPKTYYDDYPGVHTYNGNTVTAVTDVNLTWETYIRTNLGETDAQIKNGAWVKPIANAPTYTTGANNTGWYFVYATDKTIGTINAEHSTNANLQYWKRIADAYTSSERNEGKDDNVKNPLASDIVLGNGAPQKSTLYATATAAGTESGYYLYMATSGKSRPSATNQGNKFYIQTLTTNADALAENVAVYYRTISKGKALTFNGYLRYAPVGITASEGETVSYIKNPETATGKPNSYCYSADTTTAGGQGTDGAQTNPGSFHSQVNIYYFDSEGKPHVVGGVAIGWTINKRDLTAEFTANTDRTYGEDRKQEGDGTVKHDMKLVVGNIAPEAGKNAGIVITISSDNESYTFTWDGTRFDKTSAGGIVISAAGMTDPGATNGWDASDSLYNVTEPADKQTKDFSCFIDFTNAKTYTISVTTTATSGAQYTLDKTTNFSVKQATLTLKGVPTTNNPDSVIFDNKTHAFSWKVEGFKYNDDISQLALFSPTAYALGKSAPLFNSGTPNTMKTGSVTIDGVENVIYTISSNSNSIDISGARDKGEYYIAFATLSAGNYKLKLDKGVESLKQSIKLSISDNELTFDWRGAGGSHPYDKKTKGTITLTITAKSAIDGFENFVKKFFAPTMSGTGANAVWGTASDNKSITITFTTGVNAGTYTATIAQNKNETAFIEANKVNCSYPMIPQSRSYKIEKRNLTLTLKGDGTYIYNTKHQGLTTVNVNAQSGSVGIISGDSVTVSIIVTRGGETYYNYSVSGVNASAKATGVDTINHGVYVATATTGGNNNYNVATGTANWTINRKELSLSGLTGGEKVYDGTAHTPTLKVNGDEVTNGTIQWGNDTISIKFSATLEGDSAQKESLVNVGKYSIKIGGTSGNAIAVSPAKRPAGSGEVDTSDNYTISGSDSTTYEIKPRPITVTWNTSNLKFVYDLSAHGLTVSGINGGGTGAALQSSSLDYAIVKTGYGNDAIKFTLQGKKVDAGNDYEMSIKSSALNGRIVNDEVESTIDNYVISGTTCEKKFEIEKSQIIIKYAGGTTSKVYDAGFGISGKPFVFNTQSQNGGAHGTSELFDISYVYKDKNVGNDKEVVFTYVLKQNANYEYVGTGTESQDKGQITPAHIKVALDKLRSGKATRTFTNNEWYGGQAGASSGEKDGKSTVYRSGEGFTVGGVLGTDKIKVVAQYREADDSRNGTGNSFDLSSYVNDVVKNADGTFDKAKKAGTHFKTLVFTMTGDDAKNYTFNVYNKLGTDGKKYSEKDSTAGDKQTVTVYDTDDKANGNANGAEQIKIEITVKSVRVDYGNAYQSYAKADNTYNTNWEPITATSKDITAADGTIDVVNNWMYEDNDPTKPKREYHGYTTIRGSEKSTVLGATISKDKGMNFNFRLINQPVLTIAYIVENNGTYEIDTLARLLIASFYYTAHQNPGDQIFMQIMQSGYKWFEVVKGEDYSQVEFAPDLENSPITVDDTIKTWDAYINALNEAGYAVFYNETEKAWGCYVSDSSQPTALPNSYKLTKDISGKFTSDDIKVLDAFFTVTTADDNGQFTTKKYTWSGANSDYLKNVLSAAVDKVATINGSLFVSQKAEGAAAITGFDSTFDGNGYVIEYLNIMGYGKDNVGLFDVIGANGIVKNLHLRNVTINGNAKYVGGIAGKVLAAADALTEKSVKNVSFHGSINVTGLTDQSVGGLFCISERAVENAIVLGSITVSNENAKVGGVAGTLNAGLNKVVSMMQITANGGTVGAFTSNNANVGEDCKHMTNAVWQRGTGFVNVVGKNVDYNALMLGSNSLYANGTSVLGTYDVIDETFADSGQNANPRQSKRLRDMVSVYLLMYSLSVNNGKYTISSSSWLVGTADGTSENAIFIANKQNVSLLRELRFASFTLKANVSIEIASTFSGAFYGSVTSATNESGTSYGYKITCDKAMFEAYANDASAWLSVQQS